MEIGLIGGIVGVVLGIAGGALGTWWSIRAARGPRERRFMVTMAAATWAFILGFLLALWLTPPPVRIALWGAYVVLLPLLILGMNRRQAAIIRDEQDRIH